MTRYTTTTKRRFFALLLGSMLALAAVGFLGGGSAAAAGVGTNKDAVVKGTGGGSVHYREGAGLGYAIKGNLVDGEQVFVLEGPVDGWYRVNVGSHIGWIDGRYLGSATTTTTSGKTTTKATTAKPAAKATAKPAAKPTALKGYVKIANTGGDAIRVRKTAGGTVIATAGPGTVLLIKQGPTKDKSGTAWYQVSGANITGWVTAQYLVSTPAPKIAKTTVKPAAKTAPKPAAKTTPRTGTARGSTTVPVPAMARGTSSAVVNTAMQYVGYRYRWGGTSPTGFDCSGFVYFVFNKAGVPIGRSMGSEIAAGTIISSSQLQPGDLVYFANTSTRGISHISIYIGNGKIVHAADYSTGVEVSNLWSAYWAAHYAGAVRVIR